MTCASTGDPPDGVAAADPFTLLQRELANLDYTPADTGVPGIVTYTGPDGRMTATVNRADRPHHVTLAGLDLDGTPAWDVTFSAATPPHIQRILLYTVLHAGLGDEAAVLHTVVDALDVDVDAESTSAVAAPVGC